MDVVDDTGAGEAAIRIEMHLDGSMPTGHATGADGVTRAFTGWVALMSAVDAIAGGQDGRLEQEGEK